MSKKLKLKQDRVEAIRRGNVELTKLRLAVEGSLTQTKSRIREDVVKLQNKDTFTPLIVVSHIENISSTVLFPR